MSNILLIGGTGFVGSAIARRLAADGHSLRIATRRRERAKHLIVLPTVEVVESDVHDAQTLRRLMQSQDVVVSLAGILHGDFERVHTELPRKIAEAMQATGLRRIIHVSSLGAAADAPSAYHRSKAAGEGALTASGLEVTLLRPSVIFGQGDSFLSMFAEIQSFLPVFPLACPDAQLQPVWVDDVAASVAACLAHSESIGKTYELGGPRVYTLRELAHYAGKTAGRSAAIVGLIDSLSYLQALAMEIVPGLVRLVTLGQVKLSAPFTRDNYYSMRKPNVCTTAPCLPFGLEATAMEAVAPRYLRDGRPRAGNGKYREYAGR